MSFPSKPKVKLDNYLDLLLDEEIDNITKCPVCIDGISEQLKNIHNDLLKKCEGHLQEFLKQNRLFQGYYSHKNNVYPIPIIKLKKLLLLWKEMCHMPQEDYQNLYNKIFEKAEYLKAKCSPVNINVIKSIDAKLAYLLGIIYADGSLRDIWWTYKREKRFRWEISVTEELSENLDGIVRLLKEIFSIRTNVKAVYEGRWYRILFQSMILFRIFNKLFEMPMGYKKGKLRIPKTIKNSPFKIKKYFLIGFFDGDGWCSNFNHKKRFTPTIAVNQSSKEILEDLNEILKEAGLNFHINTAKRNSYKWYTLVTKDKKQIKRFQEVFHFRYSNKKERLKTLIESFEKN